MARVALLAWGEGVRSVTSGGVRATRVIFGGGAVGGGITEARLMADYAKSVLGFDGIVFLAAAGSGTRSAA